MEIGIFTYVVGILTILGFFLQIINIFPNYRSYIKHTAILFLGITIGTIIGTLQKASIYLQFPITGINLLVGSIIIIIGALVLIGAFDKDPQKRQEIFTVTFFGMLLLVTILLGHCIAKTESYREPYYTNDEVEILAEENLERGNTDRAISLYEILSNRIDSNDPRKKYFKEKIEDIKKGKLNKGD